MRRRQFLIRHSVIGSLSVSIAFSALFQLPSISGAAAQSSLNAEEMYTPFIEREERTFPTPKLLLAPKNDGDLEGEPVELTYVSAETLAPILRVSEAGSTEPFEVHVLDSISGNRLHRVSGSSIETKETVLPFLEATQIKIFAVAEDFSELPDIMVTGVRIAYVPMENLTQQWDEESRATIPNYQSITQAGNDQALVRGVSPSIAKLEIKGATCTGFLYRERYLITNYHCVRRSADFQRTRNQDTADSCGDVAYGFDHTQEGNAFKPMSITGHCQRVAHFDPGFDLAVLEIEAPPPAATGPRKSLEFVTDPLTGEGKATVVHHPLGLPQQYQTRVCTVRSDIDDDQWDFVEKINLPARYERSSMVFHDCDTEAGSSGSALVSTETGKVIALHAWSAFPMPADACSPWHNPHVQRKYKRLGYEPKNRGIPGHLIEARLAQVLE